MTNSQVSPQEAAAELLKRRKARENMLPFVQYVNPEYNAQTFHEIICDHLDKFVARIIKNLMVFIPPQHGKSELVSRKLPAHILGKLPDAKVIAASYAADLIQGMNRDTQRTMETEEYAVLYPDTQLNGSNVRTVTGSYLRNNDVFEVVGRKGQYRCAGVGGSLTGFPADFAILDDPFKGYREAVSEANRRAVWDWYISVFLTRTHANTGKLITMTRWHPDDLAGQLLALEPEEWTVLTLPGLCVDPGAPNEYRQAGQSLWQERFPPELLLQRKKLNPKIFDALYQQEPKPADGIMLQRAWLSKIVPVAPIDARRLRYWDKAGTEGGEGARTAGVKLAFAEDGKIYIEDVVKGRWSSGTREATIKQTAALDGVNVEIWVEQEPGSGGKESAENTIKNLAGYNAHYETVTGDKVSRLMPFAAYAEAGNVCLVAGTWNKEYIEEAEIFPNGLKDQMDATSGAFNKLTLGKQQNNWFD